jgi:hypothetical protein
LDEKDGREIAQTVVPAAISEHERAESAVRTRAGAESGGTAGLGADERRAHRPVVRTGLTDFGGIAKKVDLLFLRGGQNRLVAAHLGFDNFCRLLERDRGKPRLTLFVWDTGSRSDEFIRVAEAHLGGDYTHIAMTEIAPSGNQRRFVVALRGVRGELKVTVWGFTRS